MRDCSEIKKMLFLYSDRLLDREDATACSLHLESCSSCRNEYQEILNLNQNFLKRQPVYDLPEQVWDNIKKNILKRVKGLKREKKIFQTINWYRVAGVAALMALVITGTFLFLSYSSLGPYGEMSHVTPYYTTTVSQIISVGPQTTLLLKPNSQIYVVKSNRNRVQVKLIAGVISCIVKKDYFKEFAVVTPVASARVVGTSFSVSLLRPSLALFSVFEGRVKIIKDGEHKMLQAGHKLFVKGQEFIGEESALSDEAHNTFQKDIGVIQERGGETSDYLKSMVKQKPQKKSRRSGNVITKSRRSKLFRDAQAAHRGGKYAHSLDLYLKYLSEYPGDTRKDSCWDGIATNYLFLKKNGLAVDYFRLIIKESHSQDLIENSYREIWGIYLSSRNYQKSAEILEEYLSQTGLRTYRMEMLYRLAEIYRENMKDSFRAAAVYDAYTREYEDSENTGNAHYYAGVCFKAIGQSGDAEYHFKTYLNNYPDGRWAGRINKILQK
jgi:ferric-dicitrate binding protein FerR (iron transport regulator)